LYFGKHTCVILFIQELVREGHAVHVFTATHIFHFQLFITHMLWVSAHMLIHERELKNFAYAFGFESILMIVIMDES
jgi:hypothetical protein